MIIADKLQRRSDPTQVAGAAIQATLWALSLAQGPFYLARLTGFGGLSENLTSVLVVTALCWLYVFVIFLPGATPLSIQRMPRWPKIFRILADPAIPAGNKIKATFTNWFSLFLILQNLALIARAALTGNPIFS